MKSRLIWSLRVSTWRDRVLPGVIVVGAQKAGTTSLFNYLSQHPDLHPSTVKEVHYFDGGLDPSIDAFSMGERWYRSHFPLKRGLPENAQAFEASPLYMFSPLAPPRMAAAVPDAKLIAMVRNPTERAISHYFHERRKGREDASLADALQLEQSRLASSCREKNYKSKEFLHSSYKSRGLYCEQLERILTHYPRNQLLVLGSEQLFRSPAAALRRVFEFIGVDPRVQPADLRPSNVASNKHAVDRKVCEVLERYFEPYNRKLYEIAGEDFGW